MSPSNTTQPPADVLDAASQLDDAAIAEIAALQQDINSDANEYENNQARKRARLDQLNARFAAEKARREQDAAITTAQECLNAARSRYEQAFATADKRITEFSQASAAVIAAYEAAVMAERERQQLGPEFIAQAQNLTALGQPVAEPRIEPTRLHSYQRTDPQRFIATAALTGNNALVGQVNQLSGSGRRADVVISMGPTGIMF